MIHHRPVSIFALCCQTSTSIIPAITVQVNQQAEQQLVLPFNVWRGRGGPGYVEVFIAVWGRER